MTLTKEQILANIEELRHIVETGCEWAYFVDGEWTLPISNNIGDCWQYFPIRRKPWTLGRTINGHTLPEGAEWHRNDFTQEMLPAPWRPLMLGEVDVHGDELYKGQAKVWKLIYAHGKTQHYHHHCRTTRPIPAPKVEEPIDPYAELKAAHAAGKVIQKHRLGIDGYSRVWVDLKSPAWNDRLEFYRIKPDEQPIEMTELELEDVPPVSIIQVNDCRGWEEVWRAVPTMPIPKNQKL